MNLPVSDTIRHPKQRAFIACFATNGNIRKSAMLVEISRDTHYAWLTDDANYAAAFESAKQRLADELEGEAYRRACRGIKRKKFYKTEPIIDPATGKHYFERQYSDKLLMFMLRALRPEKYRENYQQQPDVGETIIRMRPPRDMPN